MKRSLPQRLYAGDPGRVWSVWAPLGLALVFWWTQAIYGFAPVDDGAMLAQAWRIAQFEVPHVDFDSIRPTASAFLHAPFTLLPWGMLAIDRLVVVLQLLWTMVAALQVLDVRRWLSPFQTFSLLVVAFLIGIGTWPIMAWHTIDGLFLGMTAVWLATRSPWNRVWLQWTLVWLLAGLAPLAKQGFGIVPLAVLAVIVGYRRWTGLRWLPVVLVPGLAYLVMTWAAPSGGAIGQITRTSSPGETFSILWTALAYAQSPEGLLVLVLTGLATLAAISRNTPVGQRLVVSIGLFSAAVIWPAFSARLDVYLPWSYASVWALIVVTALLCRSRRMMSVVVAFLVMAYSVSVSRGVDNPGLMAGILFVAGFTVVLLASTRRKRGAGYGTGVASHRLVVTVLVVALALGSIGLSWISRAAWVFAEPPRAELTASVDHPSFELIKMSPRTAAYVDMVISCVEKYPADRVAVIPDGPALYALLQLRNPFRVDWFAPGEIDYFRTGEGERVHAENVNRAIEELNGTDDWLVLMQTRPFNFINTPEEAVTPIEPVAYWPNDETIIERLDGEPVTCGSLIGKYQPRPEK